MSIQRQMRTFAALARRSLRLATVAVIALGAFPGLARADDATGKQSFVITAHALDGSGQVVASGPFSGVGEYRLVAHQDNPDGTSTDTDEFDLPDGKVFFSDTYTVAVRPTGESCTWRLEIEGTYTVTGGTGAFTAITGSGTFTATGVFVAFSEVVRGSGTTTLP